MVDQIRTLREFASPDSLFADFPSLSDFDDTYTCDVCTDSHLCSVCTEIEATLQCDISYEISTDKFDVVDVNVALAAKILSSIEKPPKPESEQEHNLFRVNPLPGLLEFNENFLVIISPKLESEQEHNSLQVFREHKKTVGWILDDIPIICSLMCMHHILHEDEAKVVRNPKRKLNPLILDVVKNEIYIAPEDKEEIIFTFSFDTFTYRRMFFGPRIKIKCTYKKFKVNEQRLKFIYESPSLKQEIIEELSLAKVTFLIIYLA